MPRIRLVRRRVIGRYLLLDRDQNSLSFSRNETSDHFLSHVLCRVVQELFKLEAREALDNLIFATDGLWVLLLKLIHSILFLVHVFDKTSASISHLTKAIGQSPLHLILACISLLAIRFLVRHVPHIVRYKLFHSVPLILL